ncbi:hypothetical protein [Candidatus Cyanaurora vandensis]|uniref:hypothetical protein n=1 Tax=Candidatus Cyanaurora vandensis TaxID=2714958 RepID=UPI00257C9D64|nr:hypothetical protein [Candidatus Cyanaurora vandensis]
MATYLVGSCCVLLLLVEPVLAQKTCIGLESEVKKARGSKTLDKYLSEQSFDVTSNYLQKASKDNCTQLVEEIRQVERKIIWNNIAEIKQNKSNIQNSVAENNWNNLIQSVALSVLVLGLVGLGWLQIESNRKWKKILEERISSANSSTMGPGPVNSRATDARIEDFEKQVINLRKEFSEAVAKMSSQDNSPPKDPWGSSSNAKFTTQSTKMSNTSDSSSDKSSVTLYNDVLERYQDNTDRQNALISSWSPSVESIHNINEVTAGEGAVPELQASKLGGFYCIEGASGSIEAFPIPGKFNIQVIEYTFDRQGGGTGSRIKKLVKPAIFRERGGALQLVEKGIIVTT